MLVEGKRERKPRAPLNAGAFGKHGMDPNAPGDDAVSAPIISAWIGWVTSRREGR